MHPWWSEDVMKKTVNSSQVNDRLPGFAGRRARNGRPKNTTTRNCKRRTRNIVRLADMKKASVSGPFGDDGQFAEFRFQVASIEKHAPCRKRIRVKAGSGNRPSSLDGSEGSSLISTLRYVP